MIRLTTSKARQEFARVLKRVKQCRRFLLERHDKAVAAIVSVEDLALLEAIENRRDLEEARRALAEYAEKGAIPWEQVEAELDLLDARESASKAPDHDDGFEPDLPTSPPAGAGPAVNSSGAIRGRRIFSVCSSMKAARMASSATALAIAAMIIP